MRKLFFFLTLSLISTSALSFTTILEDLGQSNNYNNRNIHTMLVCGNDGLSYITDVNVKHGTTVGELYRYSDYDSYCRKYRTSSSNRSNQRLPQNAESQIYRQYEKMFQGAEGLMDLYK